LRSLDRTGGEVKPLSAAFAQVGKPDPPEHARFIALQVEGHVGGGAVEEVNAALGAGPLQAEAADAITRDARQIVFAAAERVTAKLEQFLRAARQVPAQSEQALAVLAKGVEAHGYRSAVWPEDLVTFIANLSTLAIPRGVPTKEYR
jgi:hypothetical protein